MTLSLEIHGYGSPFDYDDFYNELYTSEDIYDWLESPHPRRGDVEIELESPSGTSSTLLPHRDYDFINTEGYDNWSFMSVHFWGEDPTGAWTLRTSFRASSGHIAVKHVSFEMYGVAEVPLSVSSPPSSCHSSCARGCHAEGPGNCDACRNYRLVSTLECVNECPNGTHPYNKYCLIDSEDSDSVQCPSEDPQSLIDSSTVALGAVAVLVLVALILTVVVGLVQHRRRKNQNRFRRLFNTTTAVNL